MPMDVDENSLDVVGYNDAEKRLGKANKSMQRAES